MCGALDLFSGELVFIDGLHLFEQVLRDLINVERHSTTDTVVLLHDCLPLDEVTSGRRRHDASSASGRTDELMTIGSPRRATYVATGASLLIDTRPSR